MRRILVLDADLLLRGLLTEWLEGAGYAVLHAADIEVACAQLLDDADTALVIIDLFMPKHEPPPAVTRLRAIRADVPIVATSARFRATTCRGTHAPKELTVDRLLAKPFSRTELLDAVRALVKP